MEKTYDGQGRLIVFARSDFSSNPHHPTLFDDFIKALDLDNENEYPDLLTLWIKRAETS